MKWVILGSIPSSVKVQDSRAFLNLSFLTVSQASLKTPGAILSVGKSEHSKFSKTGRCYHWYLNDLGW